MTPITRRFRANLLDKRRSRFWLLLDVIVNLTYSRLRILRKGLAERDLVVREQVLLGKDCAILDGLRMHIKRVLNFCCYVDYVGLKGGKERHHSEGCSRAREAK